MLAVTTREVVVDTDPVDTDPPDEPHAATKADAVRTANPTRHLCITALSLRRHDPDQVLRSAPSDALSAQAGSRVVSL
jgi:hypothetical protein